MKISIIGGGITGCIVALVALRKGYTVSLYEKDEIPKKTLPRSQTPTINYTF